jgi:hypothetical protein
MVNTSKKGDLHMKNWASSGVTNILLLINAVFLLILVINTSSHPRMSAGGPDEMEPVPAVTNFHGQPSDNPHEGADMGEAGAPAPTANANSNFNFQNMVSAALKCPSDPTVTLADVSCKGDDTKKRREFVTELFGQNLPPRMMFDKIIEKFGEGALTDEALEIRKNNRRQ